MPDSNFFFFSYLYQIAHLGDDDDEQEFSSATHLEEGETFFFAPRPLRNLVEVDQQESLSPILSCSVSHSFILSCYSDCTGGLLVNQLFCHRKLFVSLLTC